MTPRFELTQTAAGYARFSDGRVALVRFRRGWRWEFYTIEQRGRRRGMEMFVRYLSGDEAARLERVLSTPTLPSDYPGREIR